MGLSHYHSVIGTLLQRKIEKVVVGLGEELKSVKEKYLAVLEHFVKRLSQCGVHGEEGLI